MKVLRGMSHCCLADEHWSPGAELGGGTQGSNTPEIYPTQTGERSGTEGRDGVERERKSEIDRYTAVCACVSVRDRGRKNIIGVA